MESWEDEPVERRGETVRNRGGKKLREEWGNFARWENVGNGEVLIGNF